MLTTVPTGFKVPSGGAVPSDIEYAALVERVRAGQVASEADGQVTAI
jgi:hypothetical protein